jgi:hypothetical protein
MATADLQFANPAPLPAGQAIVAAVGDNIVAQNADDTGVDTWKFELVEIPPGSTLILGDTQGPSDTLNTYSLIPDVPGTYRIRLTVTPSGMGTVDIRDVMVPFPRRGIICPPFQGPPLPLPLPGSGDPNTKPNEMNVGGQYRGWMGDDTPGQLLLYQSLRLLDNLALPWTTELWVDQNTETPVDLRNGSIDFPFATIADAVAVVTTSSVIHVARGDYSAEMIDTVNDLTIVGPGNSPLILPNFNNPNSDVQINLYLEDATFVSSITGDINVVADRVNFQAPLACIVLSAKRSNFSSSISPGGPLSLADCTIGGNINCGDTTISITKSSFIATSAIAFTGSAGVLTLDGETLQSYVHRQCTTSNGTVSLPRFDAPVWTAYSPGITGINVGTTGSIESWYRIVGDTCQTRHVFVLGGTGITLGSIFIPLPLSLQVNQSKLQFSFQTAAIMSGRNSGGTSVAFGNPMATWSGGQPTGLTLDNAPGYTGLTAGARFCILLDMPFKIP